MLREIQVTLMFKEREKKNKQKQNKKEKETAFCMKFEKLLFVLILNVERKKKNI